jgi:hypothetical protein
VTVEMLDHLALRFGEEAQVPAVAEQSGGGADGK